jgi:coenzyme F420-reducing hydrogenase delta subunit
MQRMLEFVGIDPKRFQARWISGSEGQKFADTVTQLTEDVKALGPNRKLRDAK